MIVPGRSPDAMRDEPDASINQEKEPQRVARRIVSREPNPFEIATGSCHRGVIKKLLTINGTEITRANAEEPSGYRPKFAIAIGMTSKIRIPMAVGTDSLNVGVAAAVCLHPFARKNRV